MPDSTTPTRPRRWFRFSLRTLLVFTLLIAFLMGWIAKERMQSARERQIAKRLNERDFHVEFAGPFDSLDEADSMPRWPRKLLVLLLGIAR